MSVKNLLLVAIACVIVYYVVVMVMNKKSSTEGLSVAPYFGRPTDFAAVIKCDDDLGKYYRNKYKPIRAHRNSSTDVMDHNSLKNSQAHYTLEDDWKRKMDVSLNNTYADNKGNVYGKSNSPMTNANIPANKKFQQNDRSGAPMHEAMTDNKNAQLSASDLLPDPCMNKGKDWTNVFSDSENLLGGQNFVKFEDEHFTNQVLDTRCTKLQSQDLRRPPAIQYADISVWNKPSVCKNIYEYIRPQLDSDC